MKVLPVSSPRPRQMGVRPPPELLECGLQGLSGLRQPVRDPQRGPLVDLPHHETGRPQLRQPVREHALTDARDRPSQIREVHRPLHQHRDDRAGPALPEQFEDASDARIHLPTGLFAVIRHDPRVLLRRSGLIKSKRLCYY